MIQGMSMKQIRLMVFLENMLIGFFATLGGILLGVVFAKGNSSPCRKRVNH